MDVEGYDETIEEKYTVKSGHTLTSFTKAKRGRVTYDAKTTQLSLKEYLNSAVG